MCHLCRVARDVFLPSIGRACEGIRHRHVAPRWESLIRKCRPLEPSGWAGGRRWGNDGDVGSDRAGSEWMIRGIETSSGFGMTGGGHRSW